jgi:4-hydroxy-3-methylbut-2-enyl diphosphate reductase
MSDVLACAPLRIEALAIRAGARSMRIHKTGMGFERSKAAASLLQGDPAEALVVMGVCGALDDECEPGDVVIAEELLDGELPNEGRPGGEAPDGERPGGKGPAGEGPAGDHADCERSDEEDRRVLCPSAGSLAEALEARGVPVRRGTVVSVAHIAHGEQRVQLRERGALVVDMESAWLAAGALGRPFAVIRVVADTPSRELTRPLLTLAGAARAALSLRRTAAELEQLVREHGVHAVLGAGSATD